VASVNVANLLLTRSTSRARQLAIRASLGASRRQLVATLVVESLLLSLSATALGVLVATWGVGAAKAALPAGIARAAGIALDLRVLVAAAAAAVATGLVFGAVPAWQASRTDVVSLLKDTSATVASGRRMWRSVFLVLEVAFVGVLLVATTMIVASFVHITRAELGFERSHLISVSAFGYRGNVDDLADPLRSLPGVVSVAVVAAGSPPLIAAGFGGGSSTTTLQRSDAPEGTEPLMAEMRRVSPEYFQTAGMPFMKGQAFGYAEAGAPRAIVIDDVAARALFGDQNPVGATVRGRGPQDVFTVTGVVAHVRLNGPERASGPQAYYALAPRSGSPQLLLRTSPPLATILPAVQATLAHALPSGTPPAEVHALEDAFRRITADRRFNAGLMSIFGALALFIGAAGIYGVMASVVAQQTREIGVRVALGASAARIRRDVVAQAGRYLGAGLGLGLPAAWWTSRMFTSLLFDVRPTDPAVYAIVAALLVGVGVLAALVPARRAARVDPLIALKT
jgi:predicted permease